jgi:hypothetical protein
MLLSSGHRNGHGENGGVRSESLQPALAEMLEGKDIGGHIPSSCLRLSRSSARAALASDDGDTMDAIGAAIAVFDPDLRLSVGSEVGKELLSPDQRQSPS